MEDLLLIHEAKIKAGVLSVPPIIWCSKKKHLFHLLDTSPPFKIYGELCYGFRRRKNTMLYSEKRGEFIATSTAAEEYQEYVPSNKDVEEGHRANYIFYSNDKELKIEFKTPVGRIDITSKEIIEFKRGHLWKAGLGQLLAYGAYNPSHNKVLILFGETSSSTLDAASTVCKHYNIELIKC